MNIYKEITIVAFRLDQLMCGRQRAFTRVCRSKISQCWQHCDQAPDGQRSEDESEKCVEN
jgi:hypothetical protein